MGLTASAGRFRRGARPSEDALRCFDPEHDANPSSVSPRIPASARRLPGHTSGCSARSAGARVDRRGSRARDRIGHVRTTWLCALHFKAIFEIFHGDAEAGSARMRKLVVELSREHGMPIFLPTADFYRRGRARGSATVRPARRSFAGAWRHTASKETGWMCRSFKACSPRSKRRAEDTEAALGDRIDERAGRSPSETENTGLTRSCTASAAKSCSSAIQRTRRRPRKPSSPPSPLRNNKRRRASSCVRRCRWRSCINRPAAPPSPRRACSCARRLFADAGIPQIEEAQTLLRALAETEEVKSAVASRERRLKLQTDYGLAVAWSRGFAAEETKAAFARAQRASAGSR